MIHVSKNFISELSGRSLTLGPVKACDGSRIEHDEFYISGPEATKLMNGYPIERPTCPTCIVLMDKALEAAR